MPRGTPGRPGGLGEIEERIVGLQEVSGSLTGRFEALLDLAVVDLADFGLGPDLLAAQPSNENATNDELAHMCLAGGGKKGPVTAEAVLKAARGLGKTKELVRVEQSIDIISRALLHGPTDARSMSCNDEAARVIVLLVDGRLPVFEYTEIYNASRTMSSRDVEHARVSPALALEHALFWVIVEQLIRLHGIGRCLT
jgi:hypothetical protein